MTCAIMLLFRDMCVYPGLFVFRASGIVFAAYLVEILKFRRLRFHLLIIEQVLTVHLPFP